MTREDKRDLLERDTKPETMNRAELRRAWRETKKKKATYTLTREQLEEVKHQAVNEAVDTAFLLMLAIPMEVLLSDYWFKTGKKRMPKFIDDVIDLYKAYEKGEVTLADLERDLKEYAGITIETMKERMRYYA